MEKIDLMKCGNLRFKATVDRKEITGKIERSNQNFILTGDDGFGCVITLYELDNLLRGAKFVLKDGAFYVSDFEIVSRDPETYRDWQVGDRVHYPNGDNDIVIFRSGELVVLADDFTEENRDVTAVNTCSQLFREGWRLVLTDIEQQIIEEKKKYEPQDGDICYTKSTSGFYAIFVYNRCGLDRKTDFYVSFDSCGGLFYSGYAIETHCLEELRPATDEEKQRLFDAMAKEGKRWNAEKKVVEDIPKPYVFRKGEPVLVRDNGDRWIIAVFNKITDDPDCQYMAFNGEYAVEYENCIPYNERTMHLLGTAEGYKEE